MHENNSSNSALALDAEDEGLDYRAQALQICDELHDDDLQSMKFLSRDFLPSAKAERIENPHQLLSVWEKQGKFGKDKPWLLAECLYRTKRVDLLEDFLGYDEETLRERLDNHHSVISDYRSLLFTVAEDLDDEEFHKMMYLLDLRKKEKSKIVSAMTLLLYLEQVKLLLPDNFHKLKELLSSIERIDLVEMIKKYEDSKELSTTSSKVELMDTTDARFSTSAQSGKSNLVIAGNRPPEPISVHTVPPQVSESRLPRVIAQWETPKPMQPLIPKTQNVLDDSTLKAIAENLSHELDDKNWMVFGNELKVSPETMNQLTHHYTDMTERIYQLLKVWLHSWTATSQFAMSTIITALHNVQMHHLAERFSRLYGTQLGQPELGDISLGQQVRHPNFGVDHTNISVNTSEAKYRGPEPRPAAAVEAAAKVELPERMLGYYKMNARPRGMCIIINNEIFIKAPEDAGAKDMPNREGTQVDAAHLSETFTNLGFKVVIRNNVASMDMVRELMHISLNTDHSNYDIFVCCILSHGSQGYIYGCDGRLVNITDLTGPFKSVVCPSLAGKPKLFFIQACQGKEKQPGIEIQQDSAEDIHYDGMPTEVIPNEADFLIGYATVPGFVSYRSRTSGSWYITKLCEMLRKHGTKEDILSILTMVNREVGRANANLDGGRYKQSPAPLYTLRKKLLFR